MIVQNKNRDTYYALLEINGEGLYFKGWKRNCISHCEENLIVTENKTEATLFKIMEGDRIYETVGIGLELHRIKRLGHIGKICLMELNPTIGDRWPK